MFPEQAASEGSIDALMLLAQSMSGRFPADEADMFRMFSDSVSKGDAHANLFLGVCLSEGIGTVQSQEGAVSAWTAGSEQGDAGCMHRLAVCKINANGTEEDVPGGIRLLRTAHDMGHGDASYELGLCCLYGLLDGDAARYLACASDRGCMKASLKLAVMYGSGDGAEKDPEKAEMYRVRAFSMDSII